MLFILYIYIYIMSGLTNSEVVPGEVVQGVVSVISQPGKNFNIYDKLIKLYNNNNELIKLYNDKRSKLLGDINLFDRVNKKLEKNLEKFLNDIKNGLINNFFKFTPTSDPITKFTKGKNYHLGNPKRFIKLEIKKKIIIKKLRQITNQTINDLLEEYDKFMAKIEYNKNNKDDQVDIGRSALNRDLNDVLWGERYFQKNEILKIKQEFLKKYGIKDVFFTDEEWEKIKKSLQNYKVEGEVFEKLFSKDEIKEINDSFDDLIMNGDFDFRYINELGDEAVIKNISQLFKKAYTTYQVLTNNDVRVDIKEKMEKCIFYNNKLIKDDYDTDSRTIAAEKQKRSKYEDNLELVFNDIQEYINGSLKHFETFTKGGSQKTKKHISKKTYTKKRLQKNSYSKKRV